MPAAARASIPLERIAALLPLTDSQIQRYRTPSAHLQVSKACSTSPQIAETDVIDCWILLG